MPDLPLPGLPLWLAAHEALRHTPRIRRVWDLLADGLAAAADAARQPGLTRRGPLARPVRQSQARESAMANPSLLILPGDGIGPEVMAEVRRIIDWFGDKRGLAFDVSEDLVGGCAYDKHGTPLHDDTMAKAQEVDAVLLGAVGGPKYDELDFQREARARACCGCARRWTSSPTCARRNASTRWPISRR